MSGSPYGRGPSTEEESLLRLLLYLIENGWLFYAEKARILENRLGIHPSLVEEAVRNGKYKNYTQLLKEMGRGHIIPSPYILYVVTQLADDLNRPPTEVKEAVRMWMEIEYKTLLKAIEWGYTNDKILEQVEYLEKELFSTNKI